MAERHRDELSGAGRALPIRRAAQMLGVLTFNDASN
jgi:hypothetical protein